MQSLTCWEGCEPELRAKRSVGLQKSCWEASDGSRPAVSSAIALQLGGLKAFTGSGGHHDHNLSTEGGLIPPIASHLRPLERSELNEARLTWNALRPLGDDRQVTECWSTRSNACRAQGPKTNFSLKDRKKKRERGKVQTSVVLGLWAPLIVKDSPDVRSLSVAMKTFFVGPTAEAEKLTRGRRSVVPAPLGLSLGLSVIISLRVDGGHRRRTLRSSVGLTEIQPQDVEMSNVFNIRSRLIMRLIIVPTHTG
ncbi:hypothetical protein EYF80_006958 [Liparis tanakae]|uniref:Uncharacterized protein n=1 Tax=Liparis tanakae TaxID=230148 RepID=A0A4Z2IY71_9TELE|nr:hypothetical protein EYF80_006958 [Liparis tanakae]